MKKLIMLVSLCVLLSATAATAQTAATGGNETEMSKIYFFRSTGFSHAASAFRTFIDEQVVCKLSNKRYSVHAIPPGKHTFAAQVLGSNLTKKNEKLEITTEPGKTYYITIEMRTGIMRENLMCEEITENTARPLLVSMKPENKCE